MFSLLLLWSIFFLSSHAFAALSSIDIFSSNNSPYHKSLISDFSFRDKLPQTELSKELWDSCCGRYGPFPLRYPEVIVPEEYQRITWLRDRVVAVAKRYIGLPYLHRHIPAMGGLDCSNFTAWVYNYGLGISFVSNIRRQAYEAGRQLSPDEKIEIGDLIYVWSKDYSWVSHVAIYIGDGEIIDSRASGVSVRDFDGWYKDRFAWARRIIE